MNAQEKREIAAGAARSQLRKMNSPLLLDSAKCVLDEMAKSNPDLIAAQWWLNASENQYKIFCREWKTANPTQWEKEQG